VRPRTRTYRRGRTIYTSGDLGDRLYWVDTGRVNLVRLTEDGRELFIDSIGPGDSFGEVPALLGGQHLESAVAVGDTTVLEIPAAELTPLLEHSPQVAVSLCRRLAQRLQGAQRRFVSLMFRRLDLRLRHVLAELVDVAPEALERPLRITHQTLADRIGASRQETSRALKRLEREGVIALGYGTIQVLCSERLGDPSNGPHAPA
jgi:CRP-like cAMP-binding protein